MMLRRLVHAVGSMPRVPCFRQSCANPLAICDCVTVKEPKSPGCC